MNQQDDEGFKPDRGPNIAELRQQSELEKLREQNRELLEALKECERAMTRWSKQAGELPIAAQCAIESARDARAKAEGK